MSGSYISQVKTIIERHKVEIIVSTLISIPIFLFILFAFIENDFSVLDHSYWVGVIAFNLIVIFGVWFTLSNKTLHLSTSILYYTVGLSLVVFFLFREAAFTGDITLGVIDGAKALWDGINPYTENVVRHAVPNIPGETRLATYAYLPVDLLTYSLLLGSMNFASSILSGPEVPEFLPGFNALGILLSNLLFFCISSVIIRKVIQSEFKQAITLTLAFFTILIWNNVCLAQTLFFTGWYFHKKEQTNLTIVFWTLSMLSKYFAGIFIVSYIVEYLRKKEIIECILKSSISVIMTLTFLIPFGLMDVVNSTILFYNSEERSSDGSLGGSLFSEFVLFFKLESIVWLFTIIGFALILLVALNLTDLHKRLVVTSLLSLLVISGISAQFFPMIIFILIISKQIVFFDPIKEKEASLTDDKIYSHIVKKTESFQ
ncbi:MAG: hypothetical protein ACW97X_12955 [Candidatus Hodarchaeales archaeon]|jgi:hypothetical protein